VSSKLANKLMKAESAEIFLRSQRGGVQWQTFSTLKSEVDRLTACDLNAAAQLAKRIDELAALVEDPIARAFAEACRARVLHQQGHPADANRFYESAVSSLRRANLKGEAAMLQKSQVDVLKRLGRFQEALKIARAARRLLESPVQLAQLETNVGNVYYQLDRYDKALGHYDRARDIFSEAGEPTMRALVDLNRADVFTELDQPDEALRLFESSGKTFEKAGLSVHAALANFHIAYIQFLRGNYNAALRGYYQARERLSGLGDAHYVAFCDLEIADILFSLNSFEDALESAANARNRFHELGMHYESAKASVTRALAAMGLEEFEDTEADLLLAHRAFTEQNNQTFTALVETYLAELALHRKDYLEAIERAEASRRTFQKQKLTTRSAYSRLLAARAAYHLGDYAKAARLTRAALKEVGELFAPSIQYKGRHLLGQIERQSARPGLEHFRGAVAVIEKMRAGIAADEFKTTFLRDKIEVYEDTIKACLDDGDEKLIEEAFRLVESSKSRALADLIARYAQESEAESRGVGHSEIRERLAKLIQDLNWYSSQAGLEDEKGDQRKADTAERYRRDRARCERQIARLFRRLESESSAFAEIQSVPSSEVQDLRDTLEADECAIEYFSTGDDVSAFIASRQHIQIVRNIASRSAVEKSLTALRFQIEKFNYGAAYVDAYFGQLKRTTDGHLVDLYRQIFAPLESRLSSDRVVIIPHGLLHYVPFHALRRDATYLVDEYEMSYAPSASVLKLCRAKRRAQAAAGNSQTPIHLLALGVAEAGTPSIEEEILALSKIFPDTIQLTGSKATHDNLKAFAPQTRFLHLASHGYFRRDNPMFSFLKLADSHLHFYNLLDLELKAEMVTLSACHTGVNAIFPGDELHGLMRGFLYAGTPSMVVSLWAVNDRSTTELMRAMYAGIKAGKSKRTALRQAQLAVKDAYGHPYYWAPFVLMGDTMPVNMG
jgi:CHAT domain-containing protein